nr:MAG TPA: hypothetical protein [Herelleviridae sp.]
MILRISGTSRSVEAILRTKLTLNNSYETILLLTSLETREKSKQPTILRRERVLREQRLALSNLSLQLHNLKNALHENVVLNRTLHTSKRRQLLNKKSVVTLIQSTHQRHALLSHTMHLLQRRTSHSRDTKLNRPKRNSLSLLGLHTKTYQLLQVHNRSQRLIILHEKKLNIIAKIYHHIQNSLRSLQLRLSLMKTTLAKHKQRRH